MNDILKGQNGLSQILKSLRSVKGAKEAVKTATNEAKLYQKIQRAYPKIVEDSNAFADWYYRQPDVGLGYVEAYTNHAGKGPLKNIFAANDYIYALEPKYKVPTAFEKASKKYNDLLDEYGDLLDHASRSPKILEDIMNDIGLTRATNAIRSQIMKLESQLPELEEKSNQIYESIVSNFASPGYAKKYADEQSGLTAAKEEILKWKNIDRYEFYTPEDWGNLYQLMPPNPTYNAIDDLPFKNGGTIKSIF